MKVGMLAVALCLVALTGCSGRGEFRCENPARYIASESSPPLRIPGDLTPPDQSGALVIPPADGRDPTIREPGRCLESPPPYQGGAATSGSNT